MLGSNNMGKSIAILYFTDALEADASIKSATDIKEALAEQAIMVPLTKDTWTDRIDALDTKTLCFLATHGEIGEDGTLQAYLELKGFLHTQSTAIASGILANKHFTKLVYLSLGIPTPPWVFAGVNYGDGRVDNPLKKMKFGGSKQGIETTNQIGSDSENIYEQIIPGEFEVIVSVVRDKDRHVPLLPVLRERSMTVWGEQREADQTAVPEETKQNCQEYAQRLSTSLDCYGVTKTDFVIGAKGQIWALETDAIPGLSRSGGAGEAAKNAGMTYEDLLDMIKETVWKKPN